MTIKILKSQAENNQARTEMRRQGIDCTISLLQRILRKSGVIKKINVGEGCKSWDVFETVQFIKKNLPMNAPILDIGAYASEVLYALYRLNYTDLTGIDLNPKLNQMPYSDKIRYVVGNFIQTPFKAASFSAITAISVIEHGFKSRRLLTELSRILKVGGYFIASVDYWPEKIDTNGIEAFGMDWRIFSQEELCSFIDEAKEFGFMPFGAIDFQASEQTIKWQGRKYTFAWIVIQKTYESIMDPKNWIKE